MIRRQHAGKRSLWFPSVIFFNTNFMSHLGQLPALAYTASERRAGTLARLDSWVGLAASLTPKTVAASVSAIRSCGIQFDFISIQNRIQGLKQ